MAENQSEALVKRADLNPYYLEVGRIASQWAMLEFYMDFLIWQLAKVEQDSGACVTSQMNGIGARLRSIIALLHLRGLPEEIIKTFQQFDGSAQPLLVKRNRAVHDFWATAEGAHVVQLRAGIIGKKVDFGATEPVEINDLSKTADAIRELAMKFRDLLPAVFEIFPASAGIGPYIPPRSPRGTQD